MIKTFFVCLANLFYQSYLYEGLQSKHEIGLLYLLSPIAIPSFYKSKMAMLLEMLLVLEFFFLNNYSL